MVIWPSVKLLGSGEPGPLFFQGGIMPCKHGETAIVCGYCDNETLAKVEEKKKRLSQLEREIADGDFYDDPTSVMEPLWEERDRLKRELGLS